VFKGQRGRDINTKVVFGFGHGLCGRKGVLTLSGNALVCLLDVEKWFDIPLFSDMMQ
jgi:hypothetical protein